MNEVKVAGVEPHLSDSWGAAGVAICDPLDSVSVCWISVRNRGLVYFLFEEWRFPSFDTSRSRMIYFGHASRRSAGGPSPFDTKTYYELRRTTN